MKTVESISTTFQSAGQDVDINKELKITAFLHKTQEAAEAHANLYGCGYEHLIARNLVWVLSRMQIKILRMPKLLEPVRLDTWHKRVDRIFAVRDFLLYSNGKESFEWDNLPPDMPASEGTPIVRATSAWLLMDIQSRRMQRVEHALPHLADVRIQREAIEMLPDKLTAPEGLYLHHIHTVRFSDIDLNNHVNNTKYVEWALDCLPPDTLSAQSISELQINFNLEAVYGDNIELFIASTTPSSFYVEGRRNDQNIFQCQLSSV